MEAENNNAAEMVWANDAANELAQRERARRGLPRESWLDGYAHGKQIFKELCIAIQEKSLKVFPHGPTGARAERPLREGETFPPEYIPLKRATLEAWWQAQHAAAEPQAPESARNAPLKPLQWGTAQDAAILDAIRGAGHDPQALPPIRPGKPGVKAAIRADLDGKGLFRGTTVFDGAWERLRSRGEIANKA